MPGSILRKVEVPSFVQGAGVASLSQQNVGDVVQVVRKLRPRPVSDYKTMRLDLSKRSYELRPTEHGSSVSKKCNAFISRSVPETSEESAVELDRLIRGGRPREKPFAVKDNIATGNFSTTCASGILRSYRSPFEATVVDQLRNPTNNRKNGKVLMGKTNMDEFGMGSHSTNSFFGPVIGMRPLRRHSVGGSSGGSAMAILTGECDCALGTDTGGSVRLPAAYTGIVGFKPSYGRISRWGVIPYANSLDTVGVLGKSVADVLKMLPQEVMYSESRDPTALGVNSLYRMRDERKMLAISTGRPGPSPVYGNLVDQFIQQNFSRLKIGIPMEYNISELDPAVREEWRFALNLFQEQGCTLVPISLPNTQHALSAYYIIAAAEAASNLAKYDGVRYGSRPNSSDGAGDVLYSKTRGEGFGDEVKRRILLGSYSLSSKAVDNYFIKAQRVRRLVQRDFDQVFWLPSLLRDQEPFNLSDMDETVQMESKKGPAQVDFIVCPTAPTLPPTLNSVKKQSSVESYMNDVFTVPSSLAGIPAISIPFKLPGKKPGYVGIQIIGQFSDDFRLLLAAAAVSKLRGRKASLVHKHVAPLVRKHISGKGTGSERMLDSGLKIRKYPSLESFKVKTYASLGKSFELRKHPTTGGENRVREPRTAKEIDRLVKSAFEDWDSMTASDRQT